MNSKKPHLSTTDSLLLSMPDDILQKIFAFVGSSNHEDVFKAKTCSKKIQEIANDNYVTRRMNLDIIEKVAWRKGFEPKENTQFLEKSRLLKHPKFLFMQALGCDLSCKYGREKAISLLNTCASLGHREATLLLGIFVMEKGGDNMKKGMHFLNSANATIFKE